ncbi:MAG: substrate-binding domain-containing protein, partial [Coriobacteriia bacterium]|nr:substrate-binding domain-containing protein [Coriobacteriia bacterium]
ALEVELQITDSGTGVSSTLSGAYDIGMASRALKDSELADGCAPTQIATDAIAVIVSTDNPIDGLTKEQIREIFLGELTDWSEL